MENNQDNKWQSDEAEIDLIQLLVEILKNVKPILICAVICGLMLGGAKLGLGLYADYRAKNAPAEEDTTLNKYGIGNLTGVNGETLYENGMYKTKEEREYEQKLENYKLQVASYQAQISEVLKLISRNEEYKRNSVLLNLNPNDFYQKDAVWYVDTHYQVNPGLSMQDVNPINSIMSAYATLLSSEDFYSYVQENTGGDIDALYLRELIVSSTDPETSLIRLTVLGATEQMADGIFDASVRYLEGHKPSINNAVSNYDVTLIEEWGYDSYGAVASESVIGEGYANLIKDKQDSYNTTMTELQATVVDLQQKLLQLSEPENPGSSSLLKSFAKNGVIGGVLGIVLTGVYLVVRFIAKDAALSEDELRRRYGVFVLSSVKRFPGKSRWQRMLSKMCGDAGRTETVEEAAGLAQANIASILEANGQKDSKVLLVGSDAAALSEVERLTAGKQGGITAGGDVMTNRAAVETLRSYENVVVVERKEETSYREIGREMEKLSLLKKNVIGLIAL
ncbi:MAG: hypothetical protein E7474_06220 [Ruminococcaceae bacterium]|nr:hypothetical protein [Oscillospiraceae bacterium]